MCETGLNLQSFVYKGIHGAGWAEEEEGILHQPLYMYIHLCLSGHLFLYRDEYKRISTLKGSRLRWFFSPSHDINDKIKDLKTEN
jgi:hypothetical protein